MRSKEFDIVHDQGNQHTKSSIEGLTGINPGKSHGQGPWVSWRKHRLDNKLVDKQEDTFLLDILMMVVRLQGMPRPERSSLGLQMILDAAMRCPSQPLYT